MGNADPGKIEKSKVVGMKAELKAIFGKRKFLWIVALMAARWTMEVLWLVGVWIVFSSEKANPYPFVYFLTVTALYVVLTLVWFLYEKKVKDTRFGKRILKPVRLTVMAFHVMLILYLFLELGS